jgi:hypothetical protein
MNPSTAPWDKIAPMENIWERQVNEPERAFLRFKKYREMGSKRSLRTLAQQENVQLSSIAAISTKFNWQARVAKWDAHLDQISQQSEIDEIVAMKKRQISLALKAQKLAEQGLEKLIKQIETDDVSQIRTMDLSKLLDTGCRLERLNRNEPEQNLEIKQQQNLEVLNEEELETMRRLVAKTEGK